MFSFSKKNKVLSDYKRQVTATYDGSEAIRKVLESATTTEEIQKFYSQIPVKNADLREHGYLLHEAAKARDALEKGDIEPVLNIAGYDKNIFEVVTDGKPTPEKMHAKASLILHMDDSLDWALAQNSLAIKGFAELDMEKECTDAIRNHIVVVRDKLNKRTSIRREIDKIIVSKKPIDTYGRSIITVAMEENLIKAEDYPLLLANHPDQKFKIRALDNLHQFPEHILNHIRTENGEPDASQIHAVKTVMKPAFYHLRSDNNPEFNSLGMTFDEIMIAELQKGNQAVLDHVFDTDDKISLFLTNYGWRKHASGEMIAKDITLADLLPRDEQGEAISRARLHLARIAYSHVIPAFGNNLIDIATINIPADKLAANRAREVAQHTASVLLDDSLPPASPEKTKAQDLLRQLIVTERFKRTVNENILATDKAEYNAMKDSVRELNDTIGYGEAMLETLEDIVKTPESIAIANNIRFHLGDTNKGPAS